MLQKMTCQLNVILYFIVNFSDILWHQKIATLAFLTDENVRSHTIENFPYFRCFFWWISDGNFCLSKMGSFLVVLGQDLCYSNLLGEFLTSICLIPSLNILQLSNNNLHQDLSSALQNCTRLIIFDLGNDKFFGYIPQEIGKSLVMI